MNEPSQLSDSEITDLLRRRSARPAPDVLASAVLASLASERARHPAQTTGRSAKRPLILLAAAALLLAGGALAAGSGALRSSSITPPAPAPSFGLADFPNLTTIFVSPRNGFSIMHPDRVVITPAKQLWGFSKQVDDGFDVVETGLAAVFEGASTALISIPDGVSMDARVDEYLSDDHVLSGGCGVPRSQQAEITIDGQSGRISECPNRIEATVVAGGRLYLFTLLADRNDARAVFDAFAATIDLRPETAVDFPGLTATYVSPTNGYSFKYIDRGGLDPAKKLWDPVNQPPIASTEFNGSLAPYKAQFDVVETGLGAVFQSASTAIPGGVPIDGWVDAAVIKYMPHGCGVPRSRQAEIAIDGQSGRISECVNRIDATVVDGGRLYLFTLLHARTDARTFFDAFAATIDLRPEDAAVPAGTPSS
jgi:hypothetical protein